MSQPNEVVGSLNPESQWDAAIPFLMCSIKAQGLFLLQLKTAAPPDRTQYFMDFSSSFTRATILPNLTLQLSSSHLSQLQISLILQPSHLSTELFYFFQSNYQSEFLLIIFYCFLTLPNKI